MADMNHDAMNNDYRSAPSRPGAAHDEQSIGRMNLRNDNVSVVHSGETDTMPNREPQEAIADTDEDMLAQGSASVGSTAETTDDAEEMETAEEGDDLATLEASEQNLEDHNPGADAITAIDDPNLELVADVDELPRNARSSQPENPTAASGADVEDDDNDFEYQQHLVEDSGPEARERDADEDQEEVA